MLAALLLFQSVTVTLGCDNPNDQTMAGQIALEAGDPCLQPRTEVRDVPLTRAAPLSAARRQAIIAHFDRLLLDGPSARWIWGDVQPPGNIYCGLVNAKNAMGAYGGYKPFIVRFADHRSNRIVTETMSSTESEALAAYVLCADFGYRL